MSLAKKPAAPRPAPIVPLLIVPPEAVVASTAALPRSHPAALAAGGNLRSAVLRAERRRLPTTLDRFGAELLAALLPVPATRADELRRDLRKAGIAAFGVLQAA